MDWWFSILPRQGAASRDDAANEHQVEFATDVTVSSLERGPEPHGRARVVQRKQRAPDPEREDAVMLQRPRLSRIYWRENFFPYPLGITLTVAWRLGLVNTALIGLSYIKARIFPRHDETYLDAFFTNRFGRRLYETFFRGYTEKVWGVKCSEIRADWGAQRIKGLSLVRAITHAVRDLLSSDFAKHQQARETSLITRFFYPKLGPGQMWEVVERQVGAAGGTVRHGVTVTGITLDGNRVSHVTVTEEATGKRERMPCDFFFSTMPLRTLAAQCEPAPPANVRQVASGLVYRDFLTVGVLLTRLHVREKGREQQSMVRDTWIYVQDESVHVGRIQVFNNWSPYLVADPGTVWIGLEYFLNEADELWRMPDDQLGKLALHELEQIGIARASDAITTCVHRMPKAYPAYFGTYDRLGEIRAWVNGIPNLFCIGRNGMHRYNNQDHSMLTAMLAVDNIAAGRTDDANLWDVNLEMVYQEE